MGNGTNVLGSMLFDTAYLGDCNDMSHWAFLILWYFRWVFGATTVRHKQLDIETFEFVSHVCMKSYFLPTFIRLDRDRDLPGR